MAKSNSNTVYSGRVFSRLSSGRIAEAVETLREGLYANPAAATALGPRLERVDATYRSLLAFMLRDIPDGSRTEMLDDIRNDLRDIAQELDRRIAMADDPRLYFSTARLLDMHRTGLAEGIASCRELSAMTALAAEAGSLDADMLRRKETLFDRLFNRIWTLGPDDRHDFSELQREILDADTPYELKCLAVSALSLGLLQFYDSAKLTLLLDIYLATEDERLAARTLTAVVLGVMRWSERVRTDRRMTQRLDTLRDSLVSYRRLREVIVALIRTRDTDRVTAKMRDELLPGLMSMGPEMMKRLRESDPEAMISGIEENPEWEEMLRSTGMADKMRELSELQSQGADVMMLPFSSLKGYPFFRTLSNWFLPYSPVRSDLLDTDSLREGPVAELLEMDGIMCDSDKYSFALSMRAMPAMQRDMALSQLGANMQQMREEQASRLQASSSPAFDSEVTLDIRNMYRFYKLFQRRDDFYDPFARSFGFVDLPVIGDLMSEPEIVRLVAEFYFKRGYYREALPMLRMLTDNGSDDPHLWEKTGYCLETLQDYPGAVECYVKSDLFAPDRLWVARRLCATYLAAGRHAEALAYALRVTVSEPDDIEALGQLAGIYRVLARHDDELKILYKMDYLAPDAPDTWRLIAMAEIQAGHLDKADGYLTRLLTRPEATPEDCLAGVAAAIRRGRPSEAVALLRRARPDDMTESAWRDRVRTVLAPMSLSGNEPETLDLLLDAAR